jgi:phosphate transporter
LRSIYQLEKQANQGKPSSAVPDSENSPLLSGADEEDCDRVFSLALDRETEKICSFYQLKELEIFGELDSILKDEAAFEAEQQEWEESNEGPSGATSSQRRPRSNSLFQSFLGKRRRTSTLNQSSRDDDDSDEEEERQPLRMTRSVDMGKADHHDDSRSDFRSSRRRTSWGFEDYNDLSSSVLYDSGITLKKRLISIYVQLCELRSFIQLNRTGFTKVLKKYDKILDRSLKETYIRDHVAPAHPFQKSTLDHVGAAIIKAELAYAKLVTQGKIDEAKRELRLHLREHVVWERNTVWREMIGIERKGQAANLGIRNTMLGVDNDPQRMRLQGDEAELAMKEISTPVGKYSCPAWLFGPTLYTLVIISSIFFALLVVPIMEQQEQQNCLAMVAFVSMLWATEVSDILGDILTIANVF